MNASPGASIPELESLLNDTGKVALAYARRGWAVFPCHSVDERGRCTCRDTQCDSPGKHPRTAHGVKDATSDPTIVRMMFGTWPGANVGTATGSRSDGLVVLDVDAPDGEATLEELVDQHGKLPEAPVNLTGGGGLQLLFKSDQLLKNTVGHRGKSIDTRGEGGYIVVPPANVRKWMVLRTRADSRTCDIRSPRRIPDHDIENLSSLSE